MELEPETSTLISIKSIKTTSSTTGGWSNNTIIERGWRNNTIIIIEQHNEVGVITKILWYSDSP
jgi:hypothetical protein